MTDRKDEDPPDTPGTFVLRAPGAREVLEHFGVPVKDVTSPQIDMSDFKPIKPYPSAVGMLIAIDEWETVEEWDVEEAKASFERAVQAELLYSVIRFLIKIYGDADE